MESRCNSDTKLLNLANSAAASCHEATQNQ